MCYQLSKRNKSRFQDDTTNRANRKYIALEDLFLIDRVNKRFQPLPEPYVPNNECEGVSERTQLTQKDRIT